MAQCSVYGWLRDTGFQDCWLWSLGELTIIYDGRWPNKEFLYFHSLQAKIKSIEPNLFSVFHKLKILILIDSTVDKEVNQVYSKQMLLVSISLQKCEPKNFTFRITRTKDRTFRLPIPCRLLPFRPHCDLWTVVSVER